MFADICIVLMCGMISLFGWSQAEEWWQYGIAIFGFMVSIVMLVMTFI